MKEIQREEIISIFNRPGEVVCSEFSRTWSRHQNRQEVFEGQAAVLGVQTPLGVGYYKVEGVILYDDEYTRGRWPRSRGPEIAALNPGDVIGYSFHRSILTFVKTQGAENIMLSLIQEINRFGDPTPGEDALVSAGKIGWLIGLGHREHAYLAPFDFRGRRAFLLSVGGSELSEAELRRIEEEILLPDEELARIEREIV